MDRMGTPIGTELEVTARIDIPCANVEPGQVCQPCLTRDRGHKYVTVLYTHATSMDNLEECVLTFRGGHHMSGRMIN